MTFKITTVYADGRTEERDATPEEVAEREALLLAASVDFTMIRAERNSLLRDSDWTQLPDSPLTEEERSAWATYRQALRDMSEDFTTVDAVVWPEKP